MTVSSGTNNTNSPETTGCIVVTTDYQLGAGFQQLEQLEGENRGVGDTSTAYLARKL